jgi:hypothetical protein
MSSINHAIKLVIALVLTITITAPVLAASEPSAFNPDVHDAMRETNETIGKAIVSPVMDRFIASTSRLKFFANRLETAPSEKNLTQFLEQFYDVIENREMLRAYEFGPVHSLGYAELLDTPTDTAGITELLSNEQLFEQLAEPGSRLLQSLQGFSAIEFILQNWQPSEMPADFNLRQRQFLASLTDRVFETALAKQQAWFDSQHQNEAFNAQLVTAGTRDNAYYQTIESGSEEWVRGSINALAALIEEGLVDAEDTLNDPESHSAAVSLRGMRGLINGVALSYAGQYFAAMDGDQRVVDSAPVAPPTRENTEDLARRDGSGISHWLSIQNPALDVQIEAALMSALDMSDSMLDSSAASSIDGEPLQELSAQLEEIVDLLESQVLPVTQAALPAQ